MRPLEQSLPPLSPKKARCELARRNMLDFVTYIKNDYVVNWHHKLICEKLDNFVRGEIKRLMVFMPPQHGKEISNSVPVLCIDGWKTHGELHKGDIVFNRYGKPIKVIAETKEILSEYDVEFSDGSIIQCHGNHEWVVYDRSEHKERICETKYLYNQKLRNGIERKRGNRNRFMVDYNVAIEFESKKLPIHPYVLGAWLGDGTSTAFNITHHKDDVECIKKIISLGYELKAKWTHKNTGVITTSFGSFTEFKKLCLYNNKHIPYIYLNSSIEQRVELLAGLIDTDGYVYHKNGRVTFSNINKQLIDNVHELVISIGLKPTISEFEPIKSTSGIQGKHKVYQLCFNPDFHIPLAIKRKQLININPAKRKRAIVSITKSINPEYGKCIEVEGGIYLVGKNLIPTHNSQLVSRSLPAFILGKNPRKKIIVASYSSDLSSSFNRDCQKIIECNEYNEVFPETKLNGSNRNTVADGVLRNSNIFETVGYNGYFKSVGVGGSLTGNTADYAIIDDPVKDSLEAMSATYQFRNWNWYNDVLFTRIHNNSGILITQTRWDERDLSGLLLESMKQGRGEQWEVLSLPAIKEDNTNIEDPREIGEALWHERHSLEKINMIKRSNLRTFQSLYQQNPKPTETGGEFYKEFKVWRNVLDLAYNSETPLHISFDFNVNPAMHAVVFQVEGKKAYQIAEVLSKTPKNNTIGLCSEFKRVFQGHKGGLYVYGDPSGNNRDTRTEQGTNDYSIIKRELIDYKPIFRVARAHPSVRMRGNFINSIFEINTQGVEIFINSKCQSTINDLLFIKEDSDGSKLKEKARDLSTGVTYEKLGHLSDCLDYFICEAFKNEYLRYQNGGLQLPTGGVTTPRQTPKFTF